MPWVVLGAFVLLLLGTGGCLATGQQSTPPIINNITGSDNSLVGVLMILLLVAVVLAALFWAKWVSTAQRADHAEEQLEELTGMTPRRLRLMTARQLGRELAAVSPQSTSSTYLHAIERGHGDRG